MASKPRPSLFDPQATCDLTQKCYKSNTMNVPSRIWIPDKTSLNETQQENKLDLRHCNNKIRACDEMHMKSQTGFTIGKPMRICHETFSLKTIEL